MAGAQLLQMHLRDDEGSLVRLVQNSEPFAVDDFNGAPLTLRQPIFFCPRARLAPSQRRAQPVLLVAASDWKQLRRPAVTHEGAFGRDAELLHAADVRGRLEGNGNSYDPTAVFAAVSGDAVASCAGAESEWVCHTNGGRAFFRVRGVDASMTLVAPRSDVVVRRKEEV
eukprot:SAG31_NODE_15875_length_734_cov_0.914961_1_plen_168_part_10